MKVLIIFEFSLEILYMEISIFLEFWPKNISTYQNIGFFKLYFMNDLKHEDEFSNIPQTKTKSDFIVRSVETGSGR